MGKSKIEASEEPSAQPPTPTMEGPSGTILICKSLMWPNFIPFICLLNENARMQAHRVLSPPWQAPGSLASRRWRCEVTFLWNPTETPSHGFYMKHHWLRVSGYGFFSAIWGAFAAHLRTLRKETSRSPIWTKEEAKWCSPDNSSTRTPGSLQNVESTFRNADSGLGGARCSGLLPAIPLTAAN